MRTKRKIASNNGGFTLLEVLVAVFVLAIVALPFLNLFANNVALMQKGREITDTTYFGQAVIERLTTKSYSALYANTLPQPGTIDDATISSVTKKVRIDLRPGGSFNGLAGGKASYAHLIFSGGKTLFTCPDGTLYTYPSTAASVSITSTGVSFNGGAAKTLNRLPGTGMILIINAGKTGIAGTTVTLPSDKSVPYVLYALSPTDPVAQNITVVNGAAGKSREFRKYGSAADPPPAYMLVDAVCTVYGEGGTKAESQFEGTLQVELP